MYIGISTRNVLCYRRDDNSRVGLSHCRKHTKPTVEQVCNTHDCPPE